MKHLLLTTIAAVVMLLFGGVDEVNADPLTYRVAGGKVSIVSCDKNASGELVIPSTYEGKPVTSIGGSAFYNCSRITSARIPESVTSIGGSAFSGCSRLTSVRIPDSVTSIGDRAFRYCSNLTSVTIGNSVTSIEGWTFDYCGSLTSVRIPESVTSIGKKA
nr:leucine-rich repeat domain-containing protein [Gammaproteobacteria bacterium]